MHPFLKVTSLSLLTSALGGCLTASTDDDSPILEPDDQALIGVPVTIESTTPLELVLYREGKQGAWRPAQSLGQNRYQARVRGPYTVMTVCMWAGSPTTLLTSQALSDSRTVEIDCAFPEAPLTVSGSMVQPGRVTVGESFWPSTTPNWTFDIAASAGTYDIIASGGDRAAVQRAVEVSENRTIPAFDLATQGTLLGNATFWITNPIPGDFVDAVNWMITPRQRQAQLYRGPLTPVKVAPPSFLAAGERQEVSVRSLDNRGLGYILHSVRQPFVGSTGVTLWKPFTAYGTSLDSSGDVVGTWSGSEPVDKLAVHATDEAGRYIDHEATASYLRETGSKSLTLETDAPGYQDAWRFDPTTPHDRTIFTRRDSLGGSFQFDQSFEGDATLSAAAAGAAAASQRFEANEAGERRGRR